MVRQPVFGLLSSVALALILLIPLTRSFPLSQRLLSEADINGERLDDQTVNRDTAAYSPISFHPSRYHHRHHRRRVNMLREALVYLRKYGYLDARKPLDTEHTETALRAFQEVAGLHNTGRLDRATIERMRMSRCGNVDIEKQTKARGMNRLKRFAQVSKWTNKMDQNDVLSLQWYIQEYTKDIQVDKIREVVKKAFKLWSDQVSIPSMRTVKLDFAEGATADDADVSIKWAEGEHGDAYPFDGPGSQTNILAHTFYPNYQETGTLNGDIHFDDHEKWVLDDGATSGVHFPYVLVHEIGHALGLGHSKRQEAVMNPIYKKYPLDSIVLDIDDKCAVNWNYVGPTNTCLFVWLMVELLPRAKESNVTAHGIGTVINVTGANENELWTKQSLEERLNYTLESLQEADIPLCTDENDVQAQYEILLEQRLDFPRESAHRYGPVVCNFLDGLSKVVNQEEGVGAQISVQEMTVHAYSHPSDTPRTDFKALFDEANASQEEEEEASTSGGRKRRAHKRRHDSDESSEKSRRSIFDKDYFDEEFFRKLLNLMVERKT